LLQNGDKEKPKVMEEARSAIEKGREGRQGDDLGSKRQIKMRKKGGTKKAVKSNGQKKKFVKVKDQGSRAGLNERSVGGRERDGGD